MRGFEKTENAEIPGILNERFRIDQHVAVGGFGVLYRGYDLVRSQAVAIKVLMLANPVECDRFAREAELLAKLQHPSIVSFVDQGRTAEGQPWLAMQWLEGPDLRTRIKQQPLEVDQSVRMIERIADALSAVHDAGIVHRDIKPGNIMLRLKPESASGSPEHSKRYIA